MIKFGKFLPDQPYYNNAGVTIAQNVVPTANGYAPLKDIEIFSGAADSFIRGMFAAKDDAESTAVYAGDEKSIYKFDTTNAALVDISKPTEYVYTATSGQTTFSGSDDNSNTLSYVSGKIKVYKNDVLVDPDDYTATNGTSVVLDTGAALNDEIKIEVYGEYSTADGEIWRFVQFGEEVIATNYSDPIQTITAAAGGNFSDLAGSPPKAKFLAVVRDFVMCGYTNDTTDGEKPYRVRWSGIGDYDSWAVDADTQADYQDIADMGSVQGIVGGEYATILMEKGIVRAQYVGSPLVFEFDKVQLQRGCKISNSVANIGRLVFYLSDDGFYSFDGQQSKPIGAERVNNYFLKRFESEFASSMSAMVDPLRQIVIWSYASIESGDGRPDEMLIYNYATDNWSTANIGLDAMAPLFTAGFTLENLVNISTSLDALGSSLDSEVYKGGEYFFAGTKDNRIYTFTGENLDAVIETGEFNLQPGKSSLVNGIVPYIENNSTLSSTVSVQVASRSTQSEISTFGSSSSLNSDNFCPVRSSGKFHRVRVNISGNWNHAQGMDVDAQVRGRR